MAIAVPSITDTASHIMPLWYIVPLWYKGIPLVPKGIYRDELTDWLEPLGVGKGSGLGLDISRRIVVQKHQGNLRFESQPAN